MGKSWAQSRFKLAEGVGRQFLGEDVEFVVGVYHSLPIQKTSNRSVVCNIPEDMLLSRENMWKLGNQIKAKKPTIVVLSKAF